MRQHYLFPFLSLSILAVVLFVLAFSIGREFFWNPSAQAEKDRCGLSWRVVPSPGLGRLFDIAAVAADDMWAVGYAGGSPGGETLTVRWNGSHWLRIPSPNTRSSENRLRGIAAFAADDVWAVGDAAGRALALHWDGASWSIVPTPRSNASVDGLTVVGGTSPHDIWAVGSSWTATTTESAARTDTFILHWDGTAWSLSANSIVGIQHPMLRDVVALSSTDVWAVGSDSEGALIVRWDGATWTNVPHPARGGRRSSLYAMTALSANDIWAVGEQSSPFGSRPLLLHWNGQLWNAVTSPRGHHVWRLSARLQDVTALASDDVWAVGGSTTAILAETGSATLAMRWDGMRWSTVPTPGHGLLNAVAAVSPENVWAVGYLRNGEEGPDEVLIQQYANKACP